MVILRYKNKAIKSGRLCAQNNQVSREALAIGGVDDIRAVHKDPVGLWVSQRLYCVRRERVCMKRTTLAQRLSGQRSALAGLNRTTCDGGSKARPVDC